LRKGGGVGTPKEREIFFFGSGVKGGRPNNFRESFSGLEGGKGWASTYNSKGGGKRKELGTGTSLFKKRQGGEGQKTST